MACRVQNTGLVDPETRDIETYLQIGQIELYVKGMKQIHSVALACFLLCAAFLPSAFGNHRAGKLILPELMVAGDLNIATTTSTSQVQGITRVATFLGDGTGSFTLSAEVETVRLAAALAATDLNNDGKLDLAVGGAGPPANENGNSISTYLGDGAGSFVLQQTIDLGPGILQGEIAVGDFNEDGNSDVAFPQSGTGVLQPLAGNTALIFFGNGTGKLVAGPVLTVGTAPHTVITTDFNKDGHLDLAVSNRTDGTVSILLGDGSGNFSLSATVSVLCPTCLPEE